MSGREPDFIAPVSSGLKDYVGLFAVTSGHEVDALAANYKKEHDDYNEILLKAIADRLAEAFAESLHEEARKEYWGYAKDENLSNEELIKCSYQGIRPAPGYPVNPDHTEKYTLFDLLNAEKATGIKLTESLAMFPAASVCGIYFSHPQSKYFATGMIDEDQLIDLAKRKKMERDELAKWLRPILPTFLS